MQSNKEEDSFFYTCPKVNMFIEKTEIKMLCYFPWFRHINKALVCGGEKWALLSEGSSLGAMLRVCTAH